MRKNLTWGVLLGTALAFFYSVIVVAIYLLEGERPFAANEITLGRLVALYWVAGVLGGVVLGAVRPLAQSPLRIALVSPFVAFPVAICMELQLTGFFTSWNTDSWTSVAGMSVIFGAIGTLAVLIRAARDKR